MKSLKQKIYVITLSVISVLLSACVNALPVSSFCYIYEPIYMSEADTEYTKKQIDINNSVWLELCDKKLSY